ncbi:MAG: carbon-nitrogen hydrolase family protein, partial [Alphaproteobacteria bacterium]
MVKVAAIQMCSGMDPERNIASMDRLVREAHAAGAVYVQTPEMTGALMRDKAGLRAILRPEGTDIVAAKGAALARELGIHVHIGSTAILLDDGKVANRGLLFGPDGQLVTRYDKIHMFDVDLDNGESWRESATYRPGEEARVVDLPFGRMGFAICY